MSESVPQPDLSFSGHLSDSSIKFVLTHYITPMRHASWSRGSTQRFVPLRLKIRTNVSTVCDGHLTPSKSALPTVTTFVLTILAPSHAASASTHSTRCQINPLKFSVRVFQNVWWTHLSTRLALPVLKPNQTNRLRTLLGSYSQTVGFGSKLGRAALVENYPSTCTPVPSH